MTASIDLIRFARSSFLKLIDGLSDEHLNLTPPGFNNNLVWNLGHVIAVQQALCYLRAGQNPVIAATLMDAYQKGTAPSAPVSSDEIAELKRLAFSTITQLEEDLARGAFAAYEPFTVTPDKLPVNHIADALAFTAFHEALHLGYAQSLKRVIPN